ncbi:MAG: maltose alpha-D-glucosyltransferase [Chloroflexi bacterium]|nr:maltose alpha-D-glucosyltransferase [Chloroflexota bacterium]
MRRTNRGDPFDDNPLWYKDAIIYEVHVRAFHDSTGDGVGDFPGLTAKLDYLKDLGVTAIWLLPFYPSPLRDDGYDIADYNNVHPAYGTLNDLNVFLRQAHARGLRVITELVLNHTSDQHAWFQKSRRVANDDPWRDFYVWSDTPEKYRDARIIFKDFETSNWTWDSLGKAYYWHRFYAHQPDLNYENSAVRRAMLEIVDAWFRMGVDGLRLDAVPYLFEREGTNCENLPETHAFLKELRQHIQAQFKNRMLLAEANQWPEDAIAYFGVGDESHMAFHFPLMPRLFMSIRMEDRFPIVEILDQTPAIPETCQWAVFLRNHDELTLEMVTDEERDYMYRVYAHDRQARINLGIRRRLAPLLGNHRRRIELMNGLLFSMPGSPVIYYGDEIGMGDNIYLGDRNGVRTPMQWSADRNAGFSRANPQQLFLPIIIDPEYHYEAINVEAQQNNPHSLLWWMKRLIAMRKRYQAFGRGTIEFLHPDNHKVLAFIRRYEDERILVVANLSRFVQGVELDLAAFRGMIPIELFGQTQFPPLGEAPYFITLGPHSFYWFALAPQQVEVSTQRADVVLRAAPLVVSGTWENVFRERAKADLESGLANYLRAQRWFKSRAIKTTEIVEAIPVPHTAAHTHIVVVQIGYTEGDAERYVLPLTIAQNETAARLQQEHPQAIVARVQVDGNAGVLYDAIGDPDFAMALFNSIAQRRRLKGWAGEITATTTRAFRLRQRAQTLGEPNLLRSDHSSTSIAFGNQFIFKMYRRLDEGINPDLEISRFLTEKSFANIPSVVGALEYQYRDATHMSLAVLQEFIPNQGDAWQYTLDALNDYFERALIQPKPAHVLAEARQSARLMSEEPLSAIASELIGHYLESARLLGKRTAELHVALASDSDNEAFAPEPFTAHYQRSIYQTMRSDAHLVFGLVRQRLKNLPEPEKTRAQRLLALESELQKRFRTVFERKIKAARIRCHGDYNLEQLMYTGKDFVVIDFEGEPSRPISERRIKRSPLRDVAGMLRSFHYASVFALRGERFRSTDVSALESWAQVWYRSVSAAFLNSYLEHAAQGGFLPKTKSDLALLLDVFLASRALFELSYELNNRPDWVGIPIQGLLQVLESEMKE